MTPRERGAGAKKGRVIFTPGEVVGKRFRIVRLLGQGGMGQIFEADDLELGIAVALKAIRPEQSRNPKADQVLKREVHLARRVTHPNVCRIFDLFQHQGDDGQGREDRPVLFLTMELLAGESLSERLARTGPLSTAEALPLVRDMAEALDAAHRAGIVHHDFKTSNVMLVESPAGPRAIVTDFGLAHALERSEHAADRDEPASTLAGTPAYMAPELTVGKEATPASDVYSFGVVLFEMINGRRPLPPRGLGEAARFGPGIPHSWEATTRKCLARDPARRYPRAGAAASALAGGRSTVRRQMVAAVVAALLGGVLTASVVRFAPGEGSRPREAALEARPSVSVFGFRNLSRDPEGEWLSTALAEMLETELAAGNALRTLPGESVVGMKQGLGLTQTETLAAGTLRRVRQYLGTDFVVLGSFVLLQADAGKRIQLNVGLQDAASGELLARFAVRGSQERLFDLVREAGARLREHLGAPPGPTDASRAGAGLPLSPAATRSYARGLARLRERDFGEARSQLEQAALLDPESARIHRALASCWIGLGYDRRAAAAAQRALDLARDLDRREQLLIEGLHAETVYDWPRARQVYSSLATVFPDTPDYGLRLAAVETAGGRPEDAYATIDGLRGRFGADPRFDLAEAEAALARADLERQRRAAGRAASAFRALGAELLLARAGLLEAEALRRLGHREQAAARMLEIRRIYEDRGDKKSLAEALVRRHDISLAERDELEEALRTFSTAGDKKGVALALVRLAKIQLMDRDIAEVEAMLDEALGLGRELGNRVIEAEALNRLAACAFAAGDLTRALELFARAAGVARQSGDLSLLAGVLSNFGGLLGDHLRLEQAEEVLEEGIALSRHIGSRFALAMNLLKLSYIHRLSGRLDAADESCSRIHEIAVRLGSDDLVRLGHWCSGAVHLDRGSFGEALRLAESMESVGGENPESTLALAAAIRLDAHIQEGSFREAEERLAEAIEREPDALGSRVRLIEVLLEEGRLNEAREVYSSAEDEIEAALAENPLARFTMGRIRARVIAAGGGWREARAELETLAAETAGLGCRAFALENRLELGRLLFTKSDPSAGREHLEQLAREAGELGFGYVVRRVERILGADPSRRAAAADH